MTSAGTLQQILEFYRTRGYAARLGAGARCAIVVIDFSCAFTRGAAGFPGGDFADALAATRRLLDFGRGRVPIIFTTIAYEPDMHDAGLWAVKVPWLRTCQIDDVAVEIDPVLARQPTEPVIVKKFPSAFFGTDLHARLQQACVDTVLIAGCTTSVCAATLRPATRRPGTLSAGAAGSAVLRQYRGRADREAGEHRDNRD